MKTPRPLLLSVLTAVCLAPTHGWADGCFVIPKFVWDKHKDINEPTQKAIIVYDSGQEDLVLQVKYEGPLDQFGWLVPVPDRPTVRLGSMACFYELSRFTQRQRLNHEWSGASTMSIGPDGQSASGPPPVKVIETKTVGAYKIAVLSATDSGSLSKWLDDNHFYVPPDKSNVLDSYVRMHWYFVAVKINLGSASSHSTSKRLAAGELNPLQISFASQRCIFPLRISSIDGKPSEVEVYVLAQEPLLERGMYEHDLPLTHSNDVARAEELDHLFAQQRKTMAEMRARQGLPPQLEATPQPKTAIHSAPDEWMEFDKSGPGDLTDCARKIPRLAGRSWWIMKKTWSFAPDEMRDLDFGPALPVLAEMLGSEKYGYIASEDLATLGTNAISVVLTGIDSSSHVMSANAATVLEYDRVVISDPRMKAVAPTLLKSPDAEARLTALEIIKGDRNQNPVPIEEILPLLKDSDEEVRDTAIFAVARSPSVKKFAPQFHKMLTDTNPEVQVAGLKVIEMAALPVSHDELFPFFKIPDREAIGISVTYFRDKEHNWELSNEQALPLLHNAEPLARMIALRILLQNDTADSIALATPLLNDPDPAVRRFATRVMARLKEQ